MKVLILGHTGQLGMAFKKEVIPNIELRYMSKKKISINLHSIHH